MEPAPQAVHFPRRRQPESLRPSLGQHPLALTESKFLVYIASPLAARSPWVGRELEYWRKHCDVSKLIVVLSDGSLTWDFERGDFDRAQSTAVPPCLYGAFAGEPFFLDLRWARHLFAELWDTAMGQTVSNAPRHEDEVRSASFSPDGLRVVTASKDRSARVWDSATGRPVSAPLVHRRLCASPCSHQMAGSSSRGVRTARCASGTPSPARWSWARSM